MKTEKSREEEVEKIMTEFDHEQSPSGLRTDVKAQCD